MPVQKHAPEPKAAPQKAEGRKPWKKKSPVDVVMAQADKLRKEISEDEAALNAKKAQLKKFDEAVKLFQAV